MFSWAQSVWGAGSIGAVAAVVLGFVGCWALLPEKDETKIPKGWEQLYELTDGAKQQGMVECVIFFAAFWIHGGWPLAVGWLVFRAAAKWEAWKSLAEIPIPEQSITVTDGVRTLTSTRGEKLDVFVARSYRGGFLYRRFVLGTAINVVSGLVGAGVAHLLGPGGLSV